MVGGEFDPSMIPLYGLDPTAVMKVRQAVRANDPRAHEFITDDMVDAFSICGSVHRAGDRIDALRAAGVSEVILSFGPGHHRRRDRIGGGDDADLPQPVAIARPHPPNSSHTYT